MKLSTSTEWLFFHLWKKNPETNQSVPGVFIADTVIYRWAQPYFWYFTTRDGNIIRKTKDKIFQENIEDVYINHQPKSGIIALYMTSIQKPAKQIQDHIEFEYFNEESFVYFLNQREKSLNALLQKFIEPKNNKNSLIKVSWSPQFCLLYRKTNVHSLSNNKVPLYEKLVTFEGPEHLSESDSISSPILSTDLEQICINIVKHIQEVSGGNIQISRMVLYFKLDDKNRLWLLFCTGLKVREKHNNSKQQPQNKQKKSERLLSPFLTISTNNFKKKPLNQRQQIVQSNGLIDNSKETNCQYCGVEQELYDIKFKHLIESYEKGLVKNSDDQKIKQNQQLDGHDQQQKTNKYASFGFDFELDFLSDNDDERNQEKTKNIPSIITKIWTKWGKINEEKYLKLKENPSWLNLNAKLCLECYLKFTVAIIENEEERMAKQNQNCLKEASRRNDELFNIRSFNTKKSKSSVQLIKTQQQVKAPSDEKESLNLNKKQYLKKVNIQKTQNENDRFQLAKDVQYQEIYNFDDKILEQARQITKSQQDLLLKKSFQSQNNVSKTQNNFYPTHSQQQSIYNHETQQIENGSVYQQQDQQNFRNNIHGNNQNNNLIKTNQNNQNSNKKLSIDQQEISEREDFNTVQESLLEYKTDQDFNDRGSQIEMDPIKLQKIQKTNINIMMRQLEKFNKLDAQFISKIPVQKDKIIDYKQKTTVKFEQPKFNPAPVYNNKIDKYIKLPQLQSKKIQKRPQTIDDTINSSLTTNTSLQKVTHQFVLTTIKNLKDQFNNL